MWIRWRRRTLEEAIECGKGCGKDYGFRGWLLVRMIPRICKSCFINLEGRGNCLLRGYTVSFSLELTG